jgi:hypothetical protein
MGPVAATTSDAEFARRVFLDLTGMPPSRDELRAFLADPPGEKRARLINTLLESPAFARHWASALDVMLMERRPYQNVTAEEWHGYLLRAARENRPLHELAGELLRADGADSKLRPAARFYLDRGAEPNLITRDVGRIFFGRDLQCAQCHDHPLVKDYRQSDYHGMLAFFSSGYALSRKEGTKEISVYAEKAGTDLAFDSVFVKGDKHVTGPRAPGTGELPEPVFPPGDEYKVKPADGVLPSPRHSRRAQLASVVAKGDSRSFQENMANRLWAHVMGRGLVHPVDLHHPANPPSHPELMKLLADELAALRFDARAFLRELALTRAYQRAIDMPAQGLPAQGELAAGLAALKAKSATLEAAAEKARERYQKAVKAWYDAEAALVPLIAERDKAVAKHSEITKKSDEAQKAFADLQARTKAHQNAVRALGEAVAAAQAVVKTLPKEPELAAAAQVFLKRAAAAKAELASLEKTAGEKQLALKKALEELASAARAVESARTAEQPVRTSVRQKESTVLDTRKQMALSKTELEHHEKRIELAAACARVTSLQAQAVLAAEANTGRRAALAKAKNRAAACDRLVQTRRHELKTAEAARLAAEKTLGSARSALEHRQKLIARLDTALLATEAALEQLPADAGLRGAAATVKARRDDLRKSVPELKDPADSAKAALAKAADAVAAADKAWKGASDAQTHARADVAAAARALADDEARGSDLRAQLAEAGSDLASLLGNQFALAQLKPLSPEQLCWSILKVTGVYHRYKAAEEAELNRTRPLAGRAAGELSARRARALEIEQRTFEKLKGNVAPFVALFAAGPGQPQNDFFATADQALFAANGGVISAWIAPAAGNVAERVVQEKDPAKAADDLYLTILSRFPTAEEAADVSRVLAPAGAGTAGRPAVVMQLVWGLVTSVEFRFNH